MTRTREMLVQILLGGHLGFLAGPCDPRAVGYGSWCILSGDILRNICAKFHAFLHFIGKFTTSVPTNNIFVEVLRVFRKMPHVRKILLKYRVFRYLRPPPAQQNWAMPYHKPIHFYNPTSIPDFCAKFWNSIFIFLLPVTWFVSPGRAIFDDQFLPMVLGVRSKNVHNIVNNCRR